MSDRKVPFHRQGTAGMLARLEPFFTADEAAAAQQAKHKAASGRFDDVAAYRELLEQLLSKYQHNWN